MKKGSIFACGVCGHETPKWLGKCPVCEGWNTFQEVTAFTSSRPAERHERHGAPVLLAETGPDDAASRLRTGEGEFDRILGGGLIPGTLLLLGGEPGVGKSTLLLQVAAGLQKQGGTVLYVSGEESLLQLKTRAKRLGLLETGVLFYQENEIEHILEEAEKIHPSALVIDSIQTMRSAGTPGLPGSPAQVRDVVQALLVPAKTWGMVCLLVGHITKSGLLAGPKLIEHMVDVVLYFEGDNRYPCRVLRVTKNRFGSSREIALYDLNEEGIQPVENPSAMLLEGRRPGQSGTVVTPVLEGSLPLLVEVQALVSGGKPGTPATGDRPRLPAGGDGPGGPGERGGLPLAGRDVYVSAIGGVRAEEPACDLAVALAVASSFYDRPLPHDLAAFGELGLTGEIRRVGGGAKRWEAIKRHGFTRAVVPRGMPEKAVEGVEVTKVDTVGEMLAAMMKMKGG